MAGSAVKKLTPKARLELRRKRLKELLVKFGVYAAIVAGVVTQNAVQRFDPRALLIELDVSLLNAGQISAALMMAVGIYWKLDGKGELSGKTKNVSRVLTLGFTAGFTLMGIMGIGG